MNKYHINRNTVYIELQNGHEAIIDRADLMLVKNYHWYAKKDANTYYVRASIGKGKKVLLHRYLLNPPKDLVVDHINGNGLDNRRKNLRFATHQENSFNKRKHKRATSHYKGVSWDSSRLKWKAQIGFNKKRIHIGRFDTEIAAAMAYNEKAIELFGADFAHLNDVPIKTMAA